MIRIFFLFLCLTVYQALCFYDYEAPVAYKLTVKLRNANNIQGDIRTAYRIARKYNLRMDRNDALSYWSPDYVRMTMARHELAAAKIDSIMT